MKTAETLNVSAKCDRTLVIRVENSCVYFTLTPVFSVYLQLILR